MAVEIILRKDALAIGRVRYFTGKPCKSGHISERWSCDGQCVECIRLFQATPEFRARHKRWRDKNIHKVKAWNNRWHAANPEKVAAIALAYGPSYRLANREAIRAAAKKKYDENRDRGRALAKEWRAANPEKHKAALQKWRAENPEKSREYQSRRRAQKTAAGGSHTAEQVLDLFKKQNGKCANCFCAIKRGYHCDHIIPLVKGGSNDISNIQLLCQPCNQRKHAKDPIVWAQENGRLL